MLNLFSICNRIIPKEWTGLINVVYRMVYNFNVIHVSEKSQRLFGFTYNRSVKLEGWKFPKTKFLEKDYATIEMQNSISYLMTMPWLYAVQLLSILGTKLEKYERKLNHLIKLYRAQSKPP